MNLRSRSSLSSIRRFAGFAAALLAGAFPVAASCYVGPGAGLSAIGTVLALIGAVLLGLFGFLWYPIKRLLAKRRERARARAEKSQQPPQ
jgi:hypothetical protein